MKREEIWEALDNGVENGFGDFLINSPADDVAVDLGTFDSQFEGHYEDLIPYIETWQKQKRA